MAKALNIGFVVALGLVLLANHAFDTSDSLSAEAVGDNLVLAELEDAYSQNPGNASMALRLAAEYRSREEPQLALAALRQLAPDVASLPQVQQEYSMIYEELGQLPEAVAAGRLAALRCARRIEYVTADSSTGCSEAQLTRIELHLSVMERLVRWGVSDPELSPEKTRLAYELSYRTARVASRNE